MNDLMNGIMGPIEVEEVVHTFNPNSGFLTTITPALITYDRDPVTLSDVGTIEKIMEYAEQTRSKVRSKKIAIGSIMTVTAVASAALAFFSGGTSVVATAGLGTKIFTGLGLLSAGHTVWDSIFDPEKRYSQFLYDHMANVLGRDCINFSALMRHGVPYMCGFGGKDYTQLKTLINHQWRDGNVLQRYATANDVEMFWIVSQGDLKLPSPIRELIKQSPAFGGLTKFYSLIANCSNFGDYSNSLYK